MRVLVWQWGRRGAGPLVAAADGARLGAGAGGGDAAVAVHRRGVAAACPARRATTCRCETYESRVGLRVGRIADRAVAAASVARAVRRARAEVALCAMPAPLDLVMAAALRRAGVPYAVVVHDAERHPGDLFPLQIPLQRWLLRGAGTLFALSTHVAEQLRRRGQPAGQPLLLASLPPFVFGPPPPPVRAHGGRLRLLSFGRLLPYKGLDLLADALATARDAAQDRVRVVGSGPESAGAGPAARAAGRHGREPLGAGG